MRARAAGAVTIAAATLSLAVGCSSAPVPSSPHETLAVSGPWAADFQQAFANADSGAERDVLRDGTVTAAEYQQAKQHLRDCLADSGYTIDWDESGGFELGSVTNSYPDDFFDRSDPVLRACEAHWTGSILSLYEQVRRNPGKKDEGGIQVACLRSSGLVKGDYTAESWKRDNDAGSFPFDPLSEKAQRCALDPLGLWLPQ